MNRRIDRIDEYLRYKGMRSNRLESMCGLSSGILSKARAGLTDIGTTTINKILDHCDDMNRVWLITGDGEMLVDEENKASFIPLINIDSVGGMLSSKEEELERERLVPFERAMPGDIAVYQLGEGMMPTIPAGSIMHIRQVEEWEKYIGYGNIYVVVLRDGRRITKEISRYDADAKNYVLCVSHNKNYPPEPLPRDMIETVWKVVGVVSRQGW